MLFVKIRKNIVCKLQIFKYYCYNIVKFFKGTPGTNLLFIYCDGSWTWGLGWVL